MAGYSAVEMEDADFPDHSEGLDAHQVELLTQEISEEASDRLGKSGMTVALTLGRNSLNALTYRSYVDPQEARPDLAYYGDGVIRKRLTTEEKEDDKLRLAGSTLTAFDNKVDQVEGAAEVGVVPEKEKKVTKFGTWDGVFTSCLLNIFGVIMFLRLGWVVGQAGIPLAIVIILISTVVTTLTTLSMSAICTNGEVKAGGAYYLISRALGPKIGGAVGLLFSIGLTVAIAMYIIGFCETLVGQLPFSITGSYLNDVRVWGMIILLVILIMAYIGTGWVIKLQLILLFVLMGAILMFIVGCFTTLDPEWAIVGLNSTALASNMKPAWKTQNGIEYDFFAVFGVFFPAVTGIMAGANISGDLANPTVAIPRGTLWAIGFSTIVYIGMAILCGAAVAKEGDNGLDNAGLLWDYLIMVKVSQVPALVSIGIYIATFSSALASIVGAPRVLQSLASDKIIPFLAPFEVVRKRDDAPVRGYVLATLLCACCVAIGELNVIAPLITMFFMLTYGLINFSCMALTLSKSPGWRPSFPYYTWWGAGIGGTLCIAIMCLTSWVYTIVCFAIAFAVYKYIEFKAIPVNWGSASEGQKDMSAVKTLMNLRTTQNHAKTYRPHYLVMVGDLKDRPWLANYMGTLKSAFGAIIYAKVIESELHEYLFGSTETDQGEKSGRAARKAQEIHAGYLEIPGVSAGFRECIVSSNFRLGAQQLMQLTGLGRLKPNVVTLGFKHNWTSAPNEEVQDYVGVIRDALALDLGVQVLRGFENLDWTDTKQGQGHFDMWWLADDGGLAVLQLHILCKHRYWQSQLLGKVRLFLVVESDNEINSLFLLVQDMLRAFRIQWDIEIVTAGKSQPSAAMIGKYEELCETPVESQLRSVVTKRWLRICDEMAVKSADSKLVVVLLPFPRGHDLSRDYMALLDCISNLKAPTIMVRGNGQNVLTFASE